MLKLPMDIYGNVIVPNCGIKVGDKVRIMFPTTPEQYGDFHYFTVYGFPADIVGNIYKVAGIDQNTFLVGGWYLPVFILEKIEE